MAPVQDDSTSAVRRRWLHQVLQASLGCTVVLLSACAIPARRPTGADLTGEGYWSGRLALQVDSDPVQSWSAGFELVGRPEAGELRIATPLGQTLALLRWQPAGAELLRGSERQLRPSLAAMVRELTGTDIPIEALFSWLHGSPVRVAGWEADLSEQPLGRISARRLQPLPATTLRLQFEP
jgi:outer membrane lipoprotein LolB